MKIHACTTLVDNTRGLVFTENPRWRDDKLWFVDVFGQRILTVDVAGRMEVAAELPFKPNGFGHMRDGSILVSDALARQIHRLDGGRLELFADLTNMTVFGLSDGFVDANDRMYIGDMGYNLFDPAEKPVDTCVIVCIQPDGRADVVARGLAYPNGMVATPDGRTLIVAESYGARLTAFDIADDGSLSNQRVWAKLPEDVHPDGIGLDAEGAVWLANPENTCGRPTVLRVRWRRGLSRWPVRVARRRAGTGTRAGASMGRRRSSASRLRHPPANARPVPPPPAGVVHRSHRGGRAATQTTGPAP